MPALSQAQRRAAYAALSMKKGGLGRIGTGPAAQMAKSMSAESLKHFTHAKKGAPERVKK